MRYQILTTFEEVQDALALIRDSDAVHALDFETTSLSPKSGRIRIVSVCGSSGNYVVDFGPPSKLAENEANNFTWEFLASDFVEACVEWAVFNAGFEGRWFDYHADSLVGLLDVGVMSKAKLGGRPLSLAQQVERDLGKVRDKELQNSYWDAEELSQEQYDYAFEDAEDTYKLYTLWSNDLTEEQMNGFYVLNDAWRGTAEMEDTGMILDVGYHKGLIRMWELRRDAAERVLRKYTPESLIPNLRSKKQVGDFIAGCLDKQSLASWPKTEKTGALQVDRKALRQASAKSPYPFSRWLAAMMVFTRADKYLSTYGETLITKQSMSDDGRLHGRLNIAQAVTGRYSSSSPNLQNIPNSKVVRRSFIAPEGASMCIADYSGIELRVLAEMSGDEQLKQDVIYGNVHAESAITIFQIKDREEFMEKVKAKDSWATGRRTKAKAFSFQLTYGAGNGALSVVLKCSEDEAGEFVRRWASRYPKAFNFRHKMFELMNQTGFLPCQSGRTIYVRRSDRTIPVASNYPIQGSAGDVMYRAITRMRMAVDNPELVPFNASLLVTVHDELLTLTKDENAEHLAAVQVDQMKKAWLDIFPGTSTDNLVEYGIGKSWAAK